MNEKDQQQRGSKPQASTVCAAVGRAWISCMTPFILFDSQDTIDGGRGDDILIGGGRSSVFINAGEGDDILIGGAANDVLSGEDGDDLIDGGKDDDRLSGGDGNDVLTVGQGDDVLDGGAGNDVAQFSGSYADYRITKIAAGGNNAYRVTDLTWRDGTDTLTNIEKLSFSDISWSDIDKPAPDAVKDILDKNNAGAAFDRSNPHLIGKAQLLGNDIDYQNDTLHIVAVSDAIGGTVALQASGDVLFTPDASYKGIMSFKYSVADAENDGEWRNAA
jgi:Ca2+-binding RTX toxin-like protein